MKKKVSILVTVLLVLVLSLSIVLSACDEKDPAPTPTPGPGDNPTPGPGDDPTTPVTPVDPYAGMSHAESSAAAYRNALDEFYQVYSEARAEITDLDKRYAMMAVAEAKLLASGVMLPLTTNGGNYAISRVAPYTANSTLWGNDSYRYHSVRVATDPITSEDRAHLKAKYGEIKGTGTYLDYVEDYLTGKGYTLKNTYSLGYTADPSVWDASATSKAVDSEAIVNTYDGLYEYDVEGVQKPALATGHTVSEDGLTYTFTIRTDAKWFDSQAREIGNVSADDFVAGLQHVMDADGGLNYLLEGVIKNASEYLAGECDFEDVGVKAEGNTVVYTLEAPTPHFLTMLAYNIFAPLNRDYYESKGGKFGTEFNKEAETYTYGKTPDDIAYCGPYTVTNFTEKNTIVFTKNPGYWNAENVNIEKISWLYNDQKDPLKAYNDMKKGTLDGAGLGSEALAKSKEEGEKYGDDTENIFEKYSYVTSTDATSFMAFNNINRQAYVNFNDATAVVSGKTDAQKLEAKIAMTNVHFRRAICFAVDRVAYNAQSVGTELAPLSLRNSYTPGTFVYLTNATTVKINGKDVTFPAGTAYGEIMQAQIDADEVGITVWDPAADDGVGSTDGFDGWYNPEKAAAELALAIEELKALGVNVSTSNPIHIDLPCAIFSAGWTNRAQTYKQSMERALGGLVVLDLPTCENADEFYGCGYDTETGDQANYDIYNLSGWGPDYGDPQTYLDTFLPDGAGYMAKCIGVF